MKSYRQKKLELMGRFGSVLAIVFSIVTVYLYFYSPLPYLILTAGLSIFFWGYGFVMDKLASEPSRIPLDIRMLDNMIRYWRIEQLEATNKKDRKIACCYVDAYQTIRINHGLDLLSETEEEADVEK